jgi:hypothetical protein
VNYNKDGAGGFNFSPPQIDLKVYFICFFNKMEPSYVYNLPVGSHIFRATTINKKGRWFCLSLEDAYTYGETITEYATKRDLKLINVMSLTFHLDFIDRLNVFYPGAANSGFDLDKLKCLIPFGLVDLKYQTEALRLLKIDKTLDTRHWNDLLDLISAQMFDRHRFSEHGIDTHMTTVVEKIYGKHFEGFISPLRWPTKMHGHLFPRELCIFDTENILEEINIIKRPHAGGGESLEHISIPTDEEIDAEFKKHEQTLLQSLNEYKFVPLWNKHADEEIAIDPKRTNIHAKYLKKTRKLRRNTRA